MSILLTGPRPEFYTPGGTLKATAPSYVVRLADAQLLTAIRRGDFCYVLTPRQMGKSSLMVRTAQTLRDQGEGAAVIDLTGIGASASPEEWYLGHLRKITRDLQISVDYLDWWNRHSYLSCAQRFGEFCADILAKRLDRPSTIFIDEIDTTLNLGFSDDYFAVIRSLFNRRALIDGLDRVRIVLLGVASPLDLAKDRTRTPFNIGTRIALTDFGRVEAHQLATALAPDPDTAHCLLDRILSWTSGHPYLTQITCRAVAESSQSGDWAMERIPGVVDELVRGMYLSGTGPSGDPNLQFVRDRILHSPFSYSALRLYGRIRGGAQIRDDELDPLRSLLRLSGLIKVTKDGYLGIRNRIYEEVFDHEWLSARLVGKK